MLSYNNYLQKEIIKLKKSEKFKQKICISDPLFSVIANVKNICNLF